MFLATVTSTEVTIIISSGLLYSMCAHWRIYASDLCLLENLDTVFILYITYCVCVEVRVMDGHVAHHRPVTDVVAVVDMRSYCRN